VKPFSERLLPNWIKIALTYFVPYVLWGGFLSYVEADGMSVCLNRARSTQHVKDALA
jgi:hypothetical protein